jgi:putative SOS response-associated peptidase YedK
MIERYSIGCDLLELQERFRIEVPETYKARYNAAPGQLLPVILFQSRGLSFFYWGESPRWIKNKSISEKLINVRAEQIVERPILQKMLKRKRCLVPADGFYAWKKFGKKGVIPYRFMLKSHKVFSMPGFWEEYEDEEAGIIHTFTVITKASLLCQEITDRVPVIFDTTQEELWMSNNCSDEELISLVNVETQNVLEFYTISPKINQLEADDKSLIRPAPAADQFGNLTLFD